MAKIKKSSKKIEEKEKIDNKSCLEAYLGSIEKAAAGFAENYARNHSFKIVNCPGFDGGIKVLARTLVENNLITCEDLFNYLKSHTYQTDYTKTKEVWWDENN